jgi:hypothetical protein
MAGLAVGGKRVGQMTDLRSRLLISEGLNGNGLDAHDCGVEREMGGGVGRECVK